MIVISPLRSASEINSVESAMAVKEWREPSART